MRGKLGLRGLIALAGVVIAVACANVQRGLGDPCIKNTDCLSGVCAGQQCVPAPTTFDATPPSLDGASDATGEGGTDGGVDVMSTMPPPVDSGMDSGGSMDATHPGDGGHDGSHDATTPDGAKHDGAANDSGGHDSHAGDSAHDSGKPKDSSADRSDAHVG